MDLFSSLFRKGRRQGKNVHGITGNNPSCRVLGKKLAATLSEKSSWRQLSMYFKNKTLYDKYDKYKLFNKSTENRFTPSLFSNYHSSFVNVPTWFQLHCYFGINVKENLKTIFFSSWKMPQLFWREQSSNKQRKLEATSAWLKMENIRRNHG